MPTWMEPAIERRVNELFDGFLDNEIKDSYQDFMYKVRSLPGIKQETIFELENLFILITRQHVDISYRAGLKAGLLDGINIVK